MTQTQKTLALLQLPNLRELPHHQQNGVLALVMYRGLEVAKAAIELFTEQNESFNRECERSHKIRKAANNGRKSINQ